MRVIHVFKELYKNGVMDRFATIHSRYWPEGHKTSEGGPWHRWFINEFEKEMRKIDPEITLPYYVFTNSDNF
jgi:tyrosinase